MTDEISDHKFIVKADFYGIITTDATTSFWLPKSRGALYFDNGKFKYSTNSGNDSVCELNFSKIVKVKMESLNPRKNRWCSSLLSTPFYFLFWMPLWNPFILNITFFDNAGQPQEMFLKLKTKKITAETYGLLKKSMLMNK